MLAASQLDIGLVHECGQTAISFAQRGGHVAVAALLQHPSITLPIAQRLRQRDQQSQALRATEPWRCEQCAALQMQVPEVHEASIAHRMSGSQPAPVNPFMLSTSNRGYQMLLQDGWAEGGLGLRANGRLHPVPTTLKRDRKGLGAPCTTEARVTHFKAFEKMAVHCSETSATVPVNKTQLMQDLREDRREDQVMHALILHYVLSYRSMV